MDAYGVRDQFFNDGSGSPLFNLLAYLCSMIPNSEEYAVVERWNGCTYEKRKQIILKYQPLLDAVENSVHGYYMIAANDMDIITKSLEHLKTARLDEIYLVAVVLEGQLGDFEYYYQNSPYLKGAVGEVIKLSPLNSNWEETQLMFYPRISGLSDRRKADRSRKLGFSGVFQYYNCFRTDMASPFKVVYYFWRSTKLQEKLIRNKTLKIAASPVTNHAELIKEELLTEEGLKIKINGIRNSHEIQKKVLHLLQTIWNKDYDLIIFPEIIGSQELYEAVQEFLRSHSIHHSLILLPTYYEHGRNQGILLGPGGVELFRQNKTTAFVMMDGEEKQKEFLTSDMEIGILLIRGVGSLVLPICADLVNPDYARLVYDEHQADILLCPSYSVGSGAFANALLKGMAVESLGFWVNTCAAQEISPQRNYGFNHIGKLQMPNLKDEEKTLKQLNRECNGICHPLCYFHIEIGIKNKKLNFRQCKHMISDEKGDCNDQRSPN